MGSGDVIAIVRGGGLLAWLTVFGQWLRPDLRPWCRCHHVAIRIDSQRCIEATATGVHETWIAKYPPSVRRNLPIAASSEQRRRLVEWARRQIDDPYDIPGVIDVAVFLVTGGRLRLRRTGSRTYTCSELVAEALELAGYRWECEPVLVTPADIAQLLEGRISVGNSEREARHWKQFWYTTLRRRKPNYGNAHPQ